MKKIVKIPVSPEYLGTPKYQRIPKIRSRILLLRNAVREVVKTIEHRQHPTALLKKNWWGLFLLPLSVGACVAAELLTPQTLVDLEVWGVSLACHIVSLDKELHSTLSLFTQVYEGVPATYCWGVTRQWSRIPSRRSSNTPRACIILRKPG